MVVASGCGDDPEPWTYESNSTSILSFDLHQQFGECARANGIDQWPELTVSERGTPVYPDELRRLANVAAGEDNQLRMIAVCEPMMDEAEALFFDEHGDEYNDRFEDVAACMSDRGYDAEVDELTSFSQNPFLIGDDVTADTVADFNACSGDLYKGWLDEPPPDLN